MLYSGYDYLEVEELTKMRKIAQAHDWEHLRGSSWVSFNDDWSEATLISYETPICAFNAIQGYISFIAGAFDFSNTTCRHISVFLDKYTNGISYAECRKNIKDMVEGEIRKLSDGNWIVCK